MPLVQEVYPTQQWYRKLPLKYLPHIFRLLAAKLEGSVDLLVTLG